MIHFNTIERDGTRVNQSIPIVLAIAAGDKERIDGKKAVSLYYGNELYAILRDPEIYYHRKEERVSRQFGTSHKNHPHIKVDLCVCKKNIPSFTEYKKLFHHLKISY